MRSINSTAVTSGSFILMLFLSSPSFAVMDIKGALQETLTSNPEILSDDSSAKSKEHAIRREQAGYLPKLDVRASGGYERTKNKVKTNSCASGVNCKQDKDRFNPGVSVTQAIFDGWKTPTDVDKARTEYIQSEKKLDETRELVAYRAINAFMDVRRFQRLIKLSKQNVEAHKSILGRVNKLIDGGRASVADRHTVNSRLADAEAAVVDIQGDLDSAVARFKAIVGVEPDNLGSSAFPDELIPKSLEEAIRAATDSNRSIILARSSVDVAEAELNSTEVPFWPTLDLEADASHNRNNAGRQGYNETVTVLGVLRYNLYNGGADQARNAEIAEAVVSTRHKLDAARRTAEEEVRKSWAERDSARLQTVDLRTSVFEKDEVRKAFAKQYDLGTRTLLDRLDAENEYFLAKGSLITVEATQDLSEARLLSAMGVLLQKYSLDRASPELWSNTKNSNGSSNTPQANITEASYEQVAAKEAWWGATKTPAHTTDESKVDINDKTYEQVAAKEAWWGNDAKDLADPSSTPQASDNDTPYEQAVPTEQADDHTVDYTQDLASTSKQAAYWTDLGNKEKDTGNNSSQNQATAYKAETYNTQPKNSNAATSETSSSQAESFYDFDLGKSVVEQKPQYGSETVQYKTDTKKNDQFYDFGK